MSRKGWCFSWRCSANAVWRDQFDRFFCEKHARECAEFSGLQFVSFLNRHGHEVGISPSCEVLASVECFRAGAT